MGVENYLAEIIIMTRQCVGCKNHVARSKVKVTAELKLCAFQNCVQLITACMVMFKKYFAEIIITTRQCVVCKNMLLGQRSGSQLALKVCAFQIHVGPITSSCMMGFKIGLAETIIRQDNVLRVRTKSLGQRSRSQSAL